MGLIPPTTRSYGDGTLVKVSSERLEKWVIDLVIPELLVGHVIHFTTTTTSRQAKMKMVELLPPVVCPIYLKS